MDTKSVSNRYSHVFFSAVTGRRASLSTRIRCRMTQLFSLSRISHCMFEYQGAVLVVTFERGVIFFPTLPFIRHYPGLCAVFRVPIRHTLNLNYFQYAAGVPVPTWPPWRRWLMCGRGDWANDCISFTLACLRAGGASVPSTIATPAGLYRFLRSRGYGQVTGRNSAFRTAARHLYLGEVAGQEDLSGQCDGWRPGK